jgi:hypothetical protein
MISRMSILEAILSSALPLDGLVDIHEVDNMFR